MYRSIAISVLIFLAIGVAEAQAPSRCVAKLKVKTIGVTNCPKPAGNKNAAYVCPPAAAAPALPLQDQVCFRVIAENADDCSTAVQMKGRQRVHLCAQQCVGTRSYEWSVSPIPPAAAPAPAQWAAVPATAGLPTFMVCHTAPTRFRVKLTKTLTCVCSDGRADTPAKVSSTVEQDFRCVRRGRQSVCTPIP